MFGPEPIHNNNGGGNRSRRTFFERKDLMAEYTNAGIATVAPGQNVPLSETAASGNASIVHRAGAGLVTLRGLTNQYRAKFRMAFGGNIAIPAGGTVEAIPAALTINGEPLPTSVATVTPAAVENYFNIYVSASVDVPRGCCVTVAMRNTSAQAINFANSNMEVVRTA